VPGSRGLALLQAVLDRKARLTVMTNSLEATDAPLVHTGYSRYRRDMLKMGVELREVGATLTRESGLFGNFRSSLGRLHAKLLVIDNERLFIGSMNMDGRSAVHNTEIGLMVASPELAAQVAGLFQAESRASTYRLRLAADDQSIEWLATEAGREVTHRAEPGVGLAQRMKLSLLSAFIAEDLL
jgi:cardiolipin synthase C